VDTNPKGWAVKSIIGHVINARDLGLYSNYLYELEGSPAEQAQWS